jgi:hypothetical protein
MFCKEIEVSRLLRFVGYGAAHRNFVAVPKAGDPTRVEQQHQVLKITDYGQITVYPSPGKTGSGNVLDLRFASG